MARAIVAEIPVTGLHVDVIGRGPPLVLLHGWAMHGGVFAPLVERLRAQHTLYVVDLPGHGASRDCDVPLTLPACAAAIADCVPAAPWCGWSLGGLVALAAAARDPSRVTALAMLCATPRFVRGADWPYGISGEILEDFADGLRQDYRGTLERFIALEALGSNHAPDVIRTMRDSLLSRGLPGAGALADGLELLRHTDLRDALPRLPMPSLWIAGRRDRLVDLRAVRAAAGCSAQASVHVIEHAGHAPFLTHGATVADVLQAFLRNAPASGLLQAAS